MVITYCDICGKRINPHYDRYKLTAFEQTTGKITYDSDDVCKDCINSINNHITQIKRTVTFTEKGGD